MRESRILLLLLLGYACLVYATWHGPIDKTADGRKILTFWHTYTDQEEQHLRDIISLWEADNKAWSIRPVRIPFDGHKPKLRTALTVGHGPDMARVDWSFVCELARKNAVADLDNLGMRALLPQYVKAPMDTNLIDGHYYGIPDQTTGVALFYNRKMFRDAGLDPDQPPRTWDEFVEFGKKLTRQQDGIYAFAMDNTLWWTLPFFNTFGARLIGENGKQCLLDSKEAVQALQFKASLVSPHNIEAGAWRAGAISPEQGFVNGKYAMIFMGPWNLPKFRDLQKSGQIDFGVGLIPRGPRGTSSNVGGTNVVIFKDKPNAKVCFDFLTFFTNAANQAVWCKALNQIPVNLGAYDKVTFDDPYLMTFMEQMRHAVSNPIVTSYELLEDVVNPEMEAVLSGQKTAAEALQQAARKVEQRVLIE